MNKLRELRFLKGLTQIELEKRTGVHRTSISPIENGYVEPSPEQKKKLAEALDVDIVDIWPQTSSRNGRTLLTRVDER